MSEKLNKVIANLPQSFTTAEQKQARDNIGAQKAISYGYSASSITSIDGSSVGNPASITGVTHDYNLSGSGTSASPLGLNDPIKFSGQGTGESSKVSGASAGYRGFRIEVPSAWTANMDHNGFKANYELPSAEDTAGLAVLARQPVHQAQRNHGVSRWPSVDGHVCGLPERLQPDEHRGMRGRRKPHGPVSSVRVRRFLGIR